MKLGLGVLMVVATVASAVVVTGCKSSGDQGDTPSTGSSAAPASGDPSAQPNSGEDPVARRGRGHRGRGHGHGEWRKRRAAAQEGSDGPAPPVQE
jgi:hypothetical protein